VCVCVCVFVCVEYEPVLYCGQNEEILLTDTSFTGGVTCVSFGAERVTFPATIRRTLTETMGITR